MKKLTDTQSNQTGNENTNEKTNDKEKLAVFENKKIRRTWHNNEWYFSVVDVVEALTDSLDPKQYIKKMRQRDNTLNLEWGTICTPLKILAPDGDIRYSNCANIEGIFRIIQSIPSPKAEPFKLWLAKTGYERVQEIQNPQLALARMKEIYRKESYKCNLKTLLHFSRQNSLSKTLYIN